VRGGVVCCADAGVPMNVKLKITATTTLVIRQNPFEVGSDQPLSFVG
jgi:hypothetical protein